MVADFYPVRKKNRLGDKMGRRWGMPRFVVLMCFLVADSTVITIQR